MLTSKTRRTGSENREWLGEFMEWNTVARAIWTEIDMRTEHKGVGKLSWFYVRHKPYIPTTWWWAHGDGNLGDHFFHTGHHLPTHGSNQSFLSRVSLCSHNNVKLFFTPYIIYLFTTMDSWPKGCELWFRILAGVVGEFSSPELTLCAVSYLVSIPPPCYHSGT